MKASQIHRTLISAAIVLQLTSPALAQGKVAKAAKTPAPTSVLTLDEYLAQVRNGNEAFTAAKITTEGAGERAGEASLLTSPSLTGNINASRSQAETYNQGDDNKLTTYSLGVNEITNFGLTANLSYVINDLSTNAVVPAGYGNPNAVTAGPVLTLTGSLWRNFFGAEIRATQLQLEAAALATRYSQSFLQTQLLADAEIAYWRLALAREQVAAAREVFALTERSQKWSANRQRLALTDRSDLLQANAALLARQLDLQTALDAEKAASRYFNTVRGSDADVVADGLSSFEPTMIERLKVPDRVQFRDDVKSAEQSQRLARANALLGVERNTPTVNVVGTMGLNGRDAAFGQATSKSWSTSRPNYAIGVALNVPIDQWTGGDVRAGYRREAQAADILYKRRVFEQERIWHDQTSLFNDAVGRYKIAMDQEKAQREKVDYERQRHDRGRTTLYQVLLFESDLAASQLARIRSQADVLNAYAQLKTFGGAQ